MKSNKNQYLSPYSVFYSFFILSSLILLFPNNVSADRLYISQDACNTLINNPQTYKVSSACSGGDYSYDSAGPYTIGIYGETLINDTNGDPLYDSCYSGFAPSYCTWSCSAYTGNTFNYYSYSWNGSSCDQSTSSNQAYTECGTPASHSTCYASTNIPPKDALCDPTICNGGDSVCSNYECSAITTVYDAYGRAYKTSQCYDTGPTDELACSNINPEICNNSWDDDGDGYKDLADPDCVPLASILISPDSQDVAQGNSISYVVFGTANPNSLIPGALSFDTSSFSPGARDMQLSVTCGVGFTCKLNGSFQATLRYYNADFLGPLSAPGYEPVIVTVSTTGSTPIGPSSFTVTAIPVNTSSGNKATNDSAIANVVAPPAPIINLSATPNPVNSGTASTLSWVILNATSCTNGANMPAGNWSTINSTNTSATGNASTGVLSGSSKTYTLNCTGPGGNTSKSLTINIGAPAVSGTCGTANKPYVYNATSYGVDTFCSLGTFSWIGPGASGAFPAQGSSVSWDCLGLNGGSKATPVCTASRAPAPVTLSVNVVTSGQGTVKSTSVPVQTNINCGVLCVATYEVGTVITLTAEPSSPSRLFTGWLGDCASFGTNPICTLTINSAKSVTAKFGINPNFKEF